MAIEVCNLSDKRLSVRLNGEEIYLLPNRDECTRDDIERAFRAMEKALLEPDPDARDPKEWS